MQIKMTRHVTYKCTNKHKKNSERKLMLINFIELLRLMVSQVKLVFQM